MHRLLEFIKRIYVVLLFLLLEGIAIWQYATSTPYTEAKILSRTTAMGGYFGSRLMQNLRERNGLTYGAYAAMINLDRSGYFVMSAEVAGEATDRAIAEIMNEVERITTKPLHYKELEVVKKIIFEFFILL